MVCISVCNIPTSFIVAYLLFSELKRFIDNPSQRKGDDKCGFCRQLNILYTSACQPILQGGFMITT